MKRFAISFILLLGLTVFVVQGQAVNLALNIQPVLLGVVHIQQRMLLTEMQHHVGRQSREKQLINGYK